jgi:hypothetical protein
MASPTIAANAYASFARIRPACTRRPEVEIFIERAKSPASSIAIMRFP